MGTYPFTTPTAPPSGAAGGDLSGTYPNPTVAQVDGQALPLPVSIGGTGAATANAGFDALSPATTEGDLIYENATPTAARLPIGAVNTMLCSNGSLPSWGLGFQLQATTGAAGYTKVNSTGTIISWTAPNDGNVHRVLLMYSQHCTSAETGGAVTMTTTTPDGGTHAYQIEAGGATTGSFAQGNETSYIVEAGTAATVAQSSALSAGASVFWAEIWAC